MSANISPPGLVDVPKPDENGMLHREPHHQPLPQAFRYNNEDVQNIFTVGTLRVQCIHCTD